MTTAPHTQPPHTPHARRRPLPPLITPAEPTAEPTAGTTAGGVTAKSKTGSVHTLYTHAPHPHQPRNPNELHDEERRAKAQRAGWRGRVSAFNLWLAVWLTNHTGTMACAYIFFGIGIGSLIGVFTGNVFLAALFGSVSSYVLQLVLLPVLSVGQNVLSRHAELQADEQFHATMRALHGEEQMTRHLDAQDAELLHQTEMLNTVLTRLTSSPPPTALAAFVMETPPATPSTTPKPRRRASRASVSATAPEVATADAESL